jgi:HSF-type DNA-binding
MLSQPQFEAMIAWMPHGRAFRVLRPNDFEQQVMPIYFGHSRYSNFLSTVRQHGFKHFTQGPDKGCVYHEVSSFVGPGRWKSLSLYVVVGLLVELTLDGVSLSSFSTCFKVYPIWRKSYKSIFRDALLVPPNTVLWNVSKEFSYQ